MNDLPAIVMVPVRALPLFASTEYRTVPDPVPVAPLVIWIQLTLEEASQVHPEVVVTDTEPLPPLEPNDFDVGEIE